MEIVKADHTWCTGHATYTPGEGWKCKKTNAIIEVVFIRRSIHDGPFPLSGGGQVREIGHLHCPGCDPDWKGPHVGTPISPSEIATVA